MSGTNSTFLRRAELSLAGDAKLGDELEGGKIDTGLAGTQCKEGHFSRQAALQSANPNPLVSANAKISTSRS
jgi:hypothetical protein